ncbi:MAG: hypothetical protein WCO63_01350 [Bacteroidota bacterium]
MIKKIIFVVFIALIAFKAHAQLPIQADVKVAGHIEKYKNSILQYRLPDSAGMPGQVITFPSIGKNLIWQTATVSSQVWKKEVVGDAENHWSVPFSLNSTATILYNGQPLRSTQWTGSGSTTLNVVLDVRKYDYLVIIN